MKRGSSARFLSSCCPSSHSSFPRIVYPRLCVISPFFLWFPPPIHRPPSRLAPRPLRFAPRPLRLAPRPLPRLALPPSPPPRLFPFLLLSRGFQPLRWSSSWLAFPPNRVVGVLGCRIICALVVVSPSSRFSPPRRLTTLPPCRLYPSSLGYALCRWVMPFVVGLCPSSLWPGCGRRLAGPYSSLSGRRLSSGRRWSSVRRLSSGHRLPW